MTVNPDINLDAHQFDPTILRAYDIRGQVGKDLTEDDAYALGQAFATKVIAVSGKANAQIAVGYDGRHSSPHFEEAMTSGMMSCGAQVVRVGLGPTPMLYFAVRQQQLDGGVMITGSHNPPDYNGFKLMFAKAALFGEQITALGTIAAAGEFTRGQGAQERVSVADDYFAALMGAYKPGGRELKVAWDAGNGAAGALMSRLCEALPGTHIPLFADIDGDFPNHHPDPAEETNLQDLMTTVQEQGCDLGVAFDGDGDRLGVVDSQGRILWGDQIMQLFAADVLAKQPGATIIADVKASQTLFDKITELGGNPLIWKTGHSFVKAKMAETGAPLAGEMSGHLFFADDYYGFDDGLYAAVRLLNYLSHAEQTLDELLDDMAQVSNTPELRIEVSEARKFPIVEEVATRLRAAGAKFSDIDGVRVMTDYGWWLLRASNTQPALVARCEAQNDATLADMKQHLKQQLQLSGVEL